MIKLKIIPYALVGLTVGLSGCDRGGSKVRGSGVAKTETRTVEAFERIHIQGFAKLDVAIGEIEPLQVTADDNILPVLETTVQNGQLVIRLTVPIKPDTTITVRVRMPNITEVLCDGAGSIRLD